MFDPSSFANPTPLTHADASRDVLPRGGTSQDRLLCLSLPVPASSALLLDCWGISLGQLFGDQDLNYTILKRKKGGGGRPNRRHGWMTVDDSLFLGTWTDKQSSIPYHDVFDAGLDFVAFFSLRSGMSAIGCGDGIWEEGLRDDFLE
ncbi:hypothetical protein TNCV_4038031 [Trichonephila clavipes]|nr:hypothetical protein TNCV_4038031 [Trichonephila clavipes]